MTQSTNSTAQLSGPDNQNLPHANRTPEELEAALREDIADFDATMTAHGSRGQGTSSRARGSGQSRGQARGTVTCCGRVGRGRGPARGGITGVVSWNTFPAGSNAEGNLDLDESEEVTQGLYYGRAQEATSRRAVMASVEPALNHLGLLTRIQGSTHYNLYCKYNKVASVTFHEESIHVKERMRQCGLLWKGVDDETQKMWKDPDFVDSQRANFVQSAPEKAVNGTIALPSLQKSHFKLHQWPRDMKSNPRNLSSAHNLEGSHVLVSRDPDSTLLVTGGSLLDKQFVVMMAKKKPNPCMNFYSFVSGQVAIQATTGVVPPSPVVPTTKKQDKRYQMSFFDSISSTHEKKDNCSAVCELLGNALFDATHGEQNAWPGTNTAANLKQWNVELQVKNNYKGITPEYFCARPTDLKEVRLVRILLAIGEGWVHLIEPPAAEAEVSGFCSIGGGVNSDNSQNESDAPTSTGVKSSRTIVQAGKRLKRPTNIKKKPPRASKKTPTKMSSVQVAQLASMVKGNVNESWEVTMSLNPEMIKASPTPTLEMMVPLEWARRPAKRTLHSAKIRTKRETAFVW
ncbi:hypothetical protein PSTG_00436 [Puccinia striiformis f. sp. tritici PST-78]|uniref:Uncharacterized protein n=1 Tax=Puccinia striiformis f. sp. tritici PST-78 TaxID=1165861 RepID=A0A0L0W4V4_9BASI|nr:hypothetical protein PSTG_00436 [Puccinia striiformis f. sp. tritici PST-78]